MATAALTYYTPEEYLALERNAEFRSEYADGRIVALAGAQEPHITISLNIHAELRARFRGGPCRAWANEMRVQIEGGRRYTYPDVVAVCAPREFIDARRDTLANPALIVEVLSPSTEAYDRGEKFLHYRAIETLREYVLVAPDRPLVEGFTRHGEFWRLWTVAGLDGEVEFTSVGCTLALREIYENVDFTALIQMRMRGDPDAPQARIGRDPRLRSIRRDPASVRRPPRARRGAGPGAGTRVPPPR